MKRILALLGVCLGFLIGSILATPSQAQTPANCGVNFVPVVGVNCANVRTATYAATTLKLVPAASATDFFCISAGTKNVHVRRVEVSGTAGTLVSTEIVLLHRVALDTGTAAAATFVKTGGSLRGTNPAATATVVGYNSTGGNPTINDTSPTYIRVGNVTLGVSGTTASAVDHLVWLFGTAVDAYDQGLDIPANSTAEQFCLNLNAVSVSSGVVDALFEWTED